MAILIKLLATRIVAKSFFGFCNKLSIICIGTDLFSNPSSIFALVRENKATSEPEIKPEQTSKIMSKTALVIKEESVSTIVKIKTEGSGSKIRLIYLKW